MKSILTRYDSYVMFINKTLIELHYMYPVMLYSMQKNWGLQIIYTSIKPDSHKNLCNIVLCKKGKLFSTTNSNNSSPKFFMVLSSFITQISFFLFILYDHLHIFNFPVFKHNAPYSRRHILNF